MCKQKRKQINKTFSNQFRLHAELLVGRENKYQLTMVKTKIGLQQVISLEAGPVFYRYISSIYFYKCTSINLH